MFDKCCPNCDKFFTSAQYRFCSSKCKREYESGYDFNEIKWLRHWLEDQSNQRLPYLYAWGNTDEDLSYEFYRLVQRDT